MAQTRDSVKIPRTWWRAASVDLQRFDDCKEEVRLLRPKAEAQERVIFSLQNVLDLHRARVGELGARLTADSLLQAGMEVSHRLQIDALQVQIKQAARRQKRGTFHKILIAVGAGAVGVFVGHSLN